MEKYITVFMTVVLLCFCKYGNCQIFNFSEGIVPVNWYGQKDYFEINKAGQLQLLAPTGSTSAYVSWDIQSHGAYVWEFYVQYDFAASTTNYASFYVLSQQQNPATVGNKGYFLKIGGVAGNTDKVELYYQDGVSKTKILESKSGLAGASKVMLRLRLSKSETGNWILYSDNTGQKTFTREASAIHLSNEYFSYSAIQCIYSSTRRDKFYFDDVRISEPFVFNGFTFDNNQSLRIVFNKMLIDSTQTIQILSGSLPVISGIRIDTNELQIKFDEDVQPGIYTISLRNLYSIDYEMPFDTLFQFEKKPFYYTGQLRITELMPDPTPSYGLPEYEFIEIVNTGKSAIDLKGFVVQNSTKGCTLPAKFLQPDSCIILVPLHACPAFKLSNCVELSCFPTLHNDKDSIRIFSVDKTFMDGFYYSIDELPNDYRRQGGYSIVKTNAPTDCIISQSQTYSNYNNGGTPGFVEKMPFSDKIEITAYAVSATRFIISSNLYGFLERNDLKLPVDILSLTSESGFISNQWVLNLAAPMEEGSMIKCFVESMKSCSYVPIKTNISFDLIYPAKPQKGELFINELLYNPLSGGVDFIELINVSGKYIQTKSLHFYHIDTKNKTQHLLLLDDNLIPPEGFRVFTSDNEILFYQYSNTQQSNCFRLKPFISLPDEGGKLLLVYDGDTLDIVSYGDFLQNPLNREKEGISLEKINPYVLNFTPSNWTSSASKASAGLPNSQYYISDGHTSGQFYCKPCHVTSQSSGQSGLSFLYLNTGSGNSRGSISLYTLAGEKVLDLFTNQILASDNVFQWNGQGTGNIRLPDGIYIAVAEWWQPDGEKRIAKIPVSTSLY